MRSYEMTEIGARGLDACLDEAFEIALDDCDAVFLSVDIDVCDPGHAPGTGTPEPGGLSARELLDAVRRICRELPVAGIDVVEVSPPYDHAEITAFLANRVCLEALSGLAAKKVGITHDPAGTAAGGPMTHTSSANGAALRRPPVPRRARRTWSSRRPDRRGRAEARALGRPGPDAASSTSPAACWRPASPTRTCTRSRAGWSGSAATCPSTRPARSTSPRSARTPTATPTSSGSSAAAGRCRRSRAGRRWRPTSTPWCRTGRCSCPTATTTAPGSTRRALEIAGVTADTPDPPDGRIERDADGHPSGTLHEGATALVSRHLPRTTGADYRAALLAGQAYLHSLGVTSWQDAIVGSYSGMDDPASTYVDAAASGELRSHVVGALWWDREQGVEQVADLVGRREALTGGRFRATSVKVMQDGVAENGTAAMLEPYLDRCGHADRQHRPLLRRRRGAQGRRAPPWTPPASRCTCTRSATGRCARRWTRWSAPTRPGATTSPTCS